MNTGVERSGRVQMAGSSRPLGETLSPAVLQLRGQPGGLQDIPAEGVEAVSERGAASQQSPLRSGREDS